MHLRQAIREALKARVASLPGITSSVLDSFSIAIDQATLPRAAVSFTEETIVQHYTTNSGGAKDRTLRASVAIAGLSVETLELAVEQLEMRMNAPLMSYVSHRMLSTRFQDPDRVERDFYSVVVDYEIRYSLEDADLTRPAL